MIKTQLRMPEEVKAWVEGEAGRNERSQNAQIIWALRQQMTASAAKPQREETGVLSGQLSRPPPASSTEGP